MAGEYSDGEMQHVVDSIGADWVVGNTNKIYGTDTEFRRAMERDDSKEDLDYLFRRKYEIVGINL